MLVGGRRPGAASFFMSDPETGEASVPLPPSVGYDIEEEEEEEDDGPPGIAPLFKRDKGSEEVSEAGGITETKDREP